MVGLSTGYGQEKDRQGLQLEFVNRTRHTRRRQAARIGKTSAPLTPDIVMADRTDGGLIWKTRKVRTNQSYNLFKNSTPVGDPTPPFHLSIQSFHLALSYDYRISATIIERYIGPVRSACMCMVRISRRRRPLILKQRMYASAEILVDTFSEPYLSPLTTVCVFAEISCARAHYARHKPLHYDAEPLLCLRDQRAGCLYSLGANL